MLFCFWWDMWGLISSFCSKTSIEGRKVPPNRPIERSSFSLQFAGGKLVKHYSSLNFVPTSDKENKSREKFVGKRPDFCCVWSRAFAISRGRTEQWRERPQLSAGSSTGFGHSSGLGSTENLYLIINYLPWPQPGLLFPNQVAAMERVTVWKGLASFCACILEGIILPHEMVDTTQWL